MTTSHAPAETGSARLPRSAPPGPGSLSWDLMGRWVILTMSLRLVVLQTAHPVVGAGVDGYSDFRSEGISRFLHTVKSLQRLVYSPLVQSSEEAKRLRAIHRPIHGTDKQGRRYRGLDPNAYAWVHATLFEAVVTLSELCGEALTEDDQERFYAEWRALGDLLGLRKKDLPETVAAFRAYFQETIATRLEDNDVVRDLLDPEAIHPLPPPHVPRFAWDLVWPRFRRFAVRLTLPTLPETYARALGIEVSEAERRRMRRFYTGLGAVARALPDRWRYLPFATEARFSAGRGEKNAPLRFASEWFSPVRKHPGASAPRRTCPVRDHAPRPHHGDPGRTRGATDEFVLQGHRQGVHRLRRVRDGGRRWRDARLGGERDTHPVLGG